MTDITLSKYEYNDYLKYKKSKFREKLKLMENAKDDKLLLDDIKSVQEDFSYIDSE
jgi:hypothetical protein